MKQMQNNLKGRAPLPGRGVSRAVCEVVQGLGGGDMPTIRKYLPAALTSGAKMPTNKQLKCSLDNNVYRGYLMKSHSSGTVIYNIAPLEYYKVRREHRASQDRKLHRDHLGVVGLAAAQKAIVRKQKPLTWAPIEKMTVVPPEITDRRRSYIPDTGPWGPLVLITIGSVWGFAIGMAVFYLT